MKTALQELVIKLQLKHSIKMNEKPTTWGMAQMQEIEDTIIETIEFLEKEKQQIVDACTHGQKIMIEAFKEVCITTRVQIDLDDLLKSNDTEDGDGYYNETFKDKSL